MHRHYRLTTPVLKALGELYIQATELELLLDGGAGDDDGANVQSWRIVARTASREARRVATASASRGGPGDGVLVEARDGSVVFTDADAIQRLAQRIAAVSRSGYAIGIETGPEPVERPAALVG